MRTVTGSLWKSSKKLRRSVERISRYRYATVWNRRPRASAKELYRGKSMWKPDVTWQSRRRQLNICRMPDMICSTVTTEPTMHGIGHIPRFICRKTVTLRMWSISVGSWIFRWCVQAVWIPVWRQMRSGMAKLMVLDLHVRSLQTRSG